MDMFCNALKRVQICAVPGDLFALTAIHHYHITSTPIKNLLPLSLYEESFQIWHDSSHIPVRFGGVSDLPLDTLPLGLYQLVQNCFNITFHEP